MLDQAGVGHDSRDVALDWCQPGKQRFGLAPPGKVVLDAANNDWRAQITTTMIQVGNTEPMDSTDTVVESASVIYIDEVGRIDDTQKLLPRLRVNPEIYAEQAGHGNITSRFFHGFPGHCLFARFTAFEMPTGQVDYHETGRALFNNEEFLIVLDDDRNCQISWQHGWGEKISDAELTKLDFDFARLPDLVKHLAVEFGDCGFVGVCNSFPAFVLQTVDEGGFVGDTE